MQKFAFIIHPIDARRDVGRHPKYRLLAKFPVPFVEWVIKHKHPQATAHITGVQSITGAEAEGWFIVCPLTPRQMLSEPQEFVYQRLIECGKIAEELGAGIIGLGAFTSIVGDGGVTVARNLDIAVTTGNSYTVATALEATVDGAARMGINLATAKVAVVGATGSIGRVSAEILGEQAAELAIIGRDEEKLSDIVAEFAPALQAKTILHTDIADGLRDADVVITVTSAVDVVIQPEYLKRGCVVTDVARPRDVSVRVARERDDVLVLEGGVVAVPGADVNFNFNFGFPAQTAYACMSETMLLALDGRYESFTLGKSVNREQVETMQALAKKHGFRLAGYRSFEREISTEEIDRIRLNASRGESAVTAAATGRKTPALV